MLNKLKESRKGSQNRCQAHDVGLVVCWTESIKFATVESDWIGLS